MGDVDSINGESPSALAERAARRKLQGQRERWPVVRWLRLNVALLRCEGRWLVKGNDHVV